MLSQLQSIFMIYFFSLLFLFDWTEKQRMCAKQVRFKLRRLAKRKNNFELCFAFIHEILRYVN